MNSSLNALKLPRAPAAAWASGLAPPSRVARFGAAVWRTLEAIGQARARRELLRLADRWETSQPDLAAQLRATCREMGHA
jgi:hypothetical protein